MADTVRYLMEQMVPELEDMQKRRYFSKHEIKEIVRRRQEFEYKLKRKAALKEDFFSYAEYEARLEQLRRARRRALGLEGAKASLADYAIVRRVHFVFERAARRFKRDLGVWTRWLEFCRATRSNRRLSRVAARALQLHPNTPGLWTYVAAWELEENGAPGAARALMQQGLRMCRNSRDMWLRYLEMELVYVEKLRARRMALGLDVPEDEEAAAAAAAAAVQGRQRRDDAAGGAAEGLELGGEEAAEDGEGPVDEGAERGSAGGEGSILEHLRGSGGGGCGGDGFSGSVAAPSAGGCDAAAAVMAGAVAHVVARSAAAALPHDLQLRRGMLELVAAHAFPGTRALADGIAAGVERDFPEDPEAVDLLARRSCDPSNPGVSDDSLAAASRRFENAIAAAGFTAVASGKRGVGESGGAGCAVPAAKRQRRAEVGHSVQQSRLWLLYARFLRDRLDAALAGGEPRVQDAARAAQQLLRALQRAHDAGTAPEEAYGLWSEAALRLGQKKMALKAALLACEAHPTSAGAWQSRVALEARLRGSGAAAAGQLLGVIRAALRHVPADRAPDMWLQVLEVFKSAQDLQQLGDALASAQMGSAKGPPSGGMGFAAGRVLAALWGAAGPGAARALFARLSALPPAGGDMYREMLRLEGAALEAVEQRQGGGKAEVVAAAAAEGGGGGGGGSGAKASREALQRVRRVLEAAVDAYGDCDAALWLAYARFEHRHARMGAGVVYWRAVKALREPDAFVAEYRAAVCADDNAAG